jgi:hypothetical protein
MIKMATETQMPLLKGTLHSVQGDSPARAVATPSLSF